MTNICGSKIKRLREERKWTTAELTKKVQELGRKMSEEDLIAMEEGRDKVLDIDLCFLSQALGVSSEDILF